MPGRPLRFRACDCVGYGHAVTEAQQVQAAVAPAGERADAARDRQ